MSDADIIYNACLRAEKRLEREAARESNVGARAFCLLQRDVVALIREEIGNGLAKERR